MKQMINELLDKLNSDDGEEELMEIYNEIYQEELDKDWNFYPYNQLQFVWEKVGNKMVVTIKEKEEGI